MSRGKNYMEQDVDLEKIAEFMNSEPKETTIETKKDIESTIDFIDNQLAEVKKETKVAKTEDDFKKQQTSIDTLTALALEKMKKVDDKTDEIYDLFYKPLATRMDRSDASKEALIESQRIKVEMINALAGLANAQAKLEMARVKSATGNNNILINTMNGQDVGISLHNIWQNLPDDED